MLTHFRHLGIVTALAGITWLVATACSKSNDATGPAGPGVNGASLCESSCPKPCTQDSDCEVGNGELCCNYGSTYGQACQQAASCPVFCTSDSQCNTAGGEACCQTSLDSTQTICAASTSCITHCSSDNDCNTQEGGVLGEGTQQCELAYEQPVCVPSTEWAATCTSSSSCDTAEGQVCCTTISLAAPKAIASGTGVCLTNGSVDGIACPTACSQDSDCSTASAGKLCCNGECAATCAETCTSDSDCTTTGTQEICCGTGAISSPFWSTGVQGVPGFKRPAARSARH